MLENAESSYACQALSGSHCRQCVDKKVYESSVYRAHCIENDKRLLKYIMVRLKDKIFKTLHLTQMTVNRIINNNKSQFVNNHVSFFLSFNINNLFRIKLSIKF